MTTGKNKENFAKWYCNHDKYVKHGADAKAGVGAFERLIPLSMQWGVYLQYYEQMGLMLVSDWTYYPNEKEGLYSWNIDSKLEHHGGLGTADSLAEAQRAALKKADEIANERL